MISDFFTNKKVVYSLEVFPPKGEKPAETILPILSELSQTNPDYISVTYSVANDAMHNPTCKICKVLQNDFAIPALSHLTCINASKLFIDSQLKHLKDNEILNILALRGDIKEDFPLSDAFSHATDLIQTISSHHRFSISASCYPEPHPQSCNQAQDVKYAKIKEELGASHFITQLFFDNTFYDTMAESFEKEGIKSPVDIGIMPVVNKKQALRIISLCGASISEELSKLLDRYGDDPQALNDAGIDFATRQIINLIENGARGIHLYALNNPKVANQIYQNIKPFIDSANR